MPLPNYLRMKKKNRVAILKEKLKAEVEERKDASKTRKTLCESSQSAADCLKRISEESSNLS
jgi:predicted nuclease with TOPRIM domain